MNFFCLGIASKISTPSRMSSFHNICVITNLSFKFLPNYLCRTSVSFRSESETCVFRRKWKGNRSIDYFCQGIASKISTPSMMSSPTPTPLNAPGFYNICVITIQSVTFHPNYLLYIHKNHSPNKRLTDLLISVNHCSYSVSRWKP